MAELRLAAELDGDNVKCELCDADDSDAVIKCPCCSIAMHSRCGEQLLQEGRIERQSTWADCNAKLSLQTILDTGAVSERVCKICVASFSLA